MQMKSAMLSATMYYMHKQEQKQIARMNNYIRIQLLFYTSSICLIVNYQSSLYI